MPGFLREDAGREGYPASGIYAQFGGYEKNGRAYWHGRFFLECLRTCPEGRSGESRKDLKFPDKSTLDGPGEVGVQILGEGSQGFVGVEPLSAGDRSQAT